VVGDVARAKLMIWGASGHARVVCDIARLEGRFDVRGFLDDVNPERDGESFCGLPVHGGAGRLDELRSMGITHFVIAFGDNGARLRLAETVLEQRFALATARHPRATVALDVELGEGAVVAAGAVINPNSHVGRAVIVNTGATVDHDCALGDAVHIGPGAHLAGSVTVERGAFVGTGAVVIPGVHIGRDAIVGAGSVVVRNVDEGTVVYGNPARVAGHRNSPDK